MFAEDKTRTPLDYLRTALTTRSHDVCLNETLTEEDVKRLQRESVDLLITGIQFPEARFPGVEPKQAGTYLLEQLAQKGSANQTTPKMVFSVVCDIGAMNKALKYVEKYVQRSLSNLEDYGILLETVDKLLG